MNTEKTKEVFLKAIIENILPFLTGKPCQWPKIMYNLFFLIYFLSNLSIQYVRLQLTI